MNYFFNYHFKICNLFISEESGSICNVQFDKSRIPDHFVRKETVLIKKAAAQLDEYFCGKRKVFELPLVLHGTVFQVRVWNALKKIPFGKTRSYGEIAAMIGNPKACRAVGMANNRNPVAIIVPCHRVIGSDGSLTGYGGGLELKRNLLKLEGFNFSAQ